MLAPDFSEKNKKENKEQKPQEEELPISEKERIIASAPEVEKEETAYIPSPSSEKELNILKEADKLREMKAEGKKIKHLLYLAQTKSVEFAVEVAKKSEDACLLDLFHDKLIEKGIRPK